MFISKSPGRSRLPEAHALRNNSVASAGDASNAQPDEEADEEAAGVATLDEGADEEEAGLKAALAAAFLPPRGRCFLQRCSLHFSRYLFSRTGPPVRFLMQSCLLPCPWFFRSLRAWCQNTLSQLDYAANDFRSAFMYR